MLQRLYAKWMFAWEYALTTRDENRIERPLEWGFEHLADFGGVEAAEALARGEMTGLEAMSALNAQIVASPEEFYSYLSPMDFRIEMQFPELYPTNVRPETLEQEREWKRQAEVGELRKEPFLRFTSAVKTPYDENNVVNARWYPEEAGSRKQEAASSANGSAAASAKQILRFAKEDNSKIIGEKRKPKQAMIVMPQWNADAFSHNAFGEMFQKFGVATLRLSKPYHDVRRPAELERSDYAVSANVGRTIEAARQAVADIRSCVDWLESQGYEQIGVLGTSLGSCYAFLAAAMDKRLQVCVFNHASTQFGDVVWTGQSTRHVRSAFERAELTQAQVREMFAGISPMSFMEQFAANPKRVLVVHATYDLTFLAEFSLDVLKNFKAHGVDFVSKVLPCGHYTTGETPYKYMDGWFIGSFVWSTFRRLAKAAVGQG